MVGLILHLNNYAAELIFIQKLTKQLEKKPKQISQWPLW